MCAGASMHMDLPCCAQASDRGITTVMPARSAHSCSSCVCDAHAAGSVPLSELLRSNSEDRKVSRLHDSGRDDVSMLWDRSSTCNHIGVVWQQRQSPWEACLQRAACTSALRLLCQAPPAQVMLMYAPLAVPLPTMRQAGCHAARFGSHRGAAGLAGCHMQGAACRSARCG